MRSIKSMAGLALAGLLLLLGLTAVQAASNGGYSANWWVVAGGGVAGSGGAYTLGGTTGQPAVGTVSGGAYTLAAGFWQGGAVISPNPLNKFQYIPRIDHN